MARELRYRNAREDYDQLASGYDFAYQRRRDLLEDEWLAQHLLAGGFLERGHHILDLGCGTGGFLDLAHSMARPIDPHRYIGVDVSLGMLAEASRKWRSHVFHRHDIGNVAEQPWFEERPWVVVSLFGAASYAYLPHLQHLVGGRPHCLMFFTGRRLRARNPRVPAKNLAKAYTGKDLRERFPDSHIQGLTLATPFHGLWQDTVALWLPGACRYYVVTQLPIDVVELEDRIRLLHIGYPKEQTWRLPTEQPAG